MKMTCPRAMPSTAKPRGLYISSLVQLQIIWSKGSIHQYYTISARYIKVLNKLGTTTFLMHHLLQLSTKERNSNARICPLKTTPL